LRPTAGLVHPSLQGARNARDAKLAPRTATGHVPGDESAPHRCGYPRFESRPPGDGPLA
jgi:hypothetical protein